MNGTCIKKKIIGCKNTKSVYYIRFFQEKVRKMNKKSPIGEKKNNNRRLKAVTEQDLPVSDLCIIRLVTTGISLMSRWRPD